MTVARLRLGPLRPVLLLLSLVALVLAALVVTGSGPRSQENPMAAPTFKVEEDEPEAATALPEPPAPLSSAERLRMVTAPIPPQRPWSQPARPATAGTPAKAEQQDAEQEKVPEASKAQGQQSPALGVPVDAPVPPRRPGAPEPEVVSAEPPPAPTPDPPFSLEPDMRVAFAPPIAIPSTTEEIEAEEARTPEPTLVEKQTDAVDIACIKPEVLDLVRAAGERFGGTPVITSGQRDRGRRGSFHRRCMAADFFIPGVERALLAKYLRGTVGAGGVGTYCHTKSVHIDIGEPRNWYQCGRRFRFAQR